MRTNLENLLQIYKKEKETVLEEYFHTHSDQVWLCGYNSSRIETLSWVIEGLEGILQ